MRARIPTLIVSVAVVLGFSLFGLSAPAQATPYNCFLGYTASGGGTTAYCNHGTGQLRALASCVWPATGAKTAAYGGWINTRDNGGGTSTANCPSSNPLAVDVGYETR